MNHKNVKVAMIGAGGCGKSTIASRLVTGSFLDQTMTRGLNIDTWSIVDCEEEAVITAAIFDLGGQEQFRFFHEDLAQGAHMVMLVFDVSRFKTMLEIDEWLGLIEHIPKEKWILVGNKTDLNATIEESEIKAKAEELGIRYVLVSTKTGDNFEELASSVKRILRDT
ncbi:MAG: GTP-binding protein [Candidatus Thorarchaeota archaeon]|nr:MAG: GTP-binding protein [Candidatus Thorarchaeota archaeon]